MYALNLDGTDAVAHSSSDEEFDDDGEMEDAFQSDQNLEIDVQSRSSSIDSAINSGGAMQEEVVA
jgi:mevalonate kinase